MSQDQHIKNFSALDIERYHKGLLTSSEMNKMEKAALEDPFLADAMEGYAVTGVDTKNDLLELEKKIATHISSEREPKVIPMQRTSFTWLKVAAMIVFIVGAGLLAYQLGFNKEQKNIAQVNDNLANKKEELTIGPPRPIATEKSSELSPSGLLTDSTNAIASGVNRNKKSGSIDTYKVSSENETKDDNAGIVAAKPVTPDNRLLEAQIQEKTEDKKEIVLKDQDQSDKEVAAQNRTLEFSKQKVVAPGAVSGKAAREQALQSVNIFTGRITDAQNNALPFANITNQADNIGTYSDAKGYFALTSPDTAMQVEVRSVGFSNSQIELRNADKNLPTANQIILKEDHSSLAQVTISNVKRNSVRTRDNNNNMVLDDAEPADGWINYDLYLANNLKAPDKIQRKQNSNGEVELSFEVDKNGAPINISVVRSLCETCDKEAIRLLREGPKWKKKKKNGKTTVTVGF